MDKKLIKAARAIMSEHFYCAGIERGDFRIVAGDCLDYHALWSENRSLSKKINAGEINNKVSIIAEFIDTFEPPKDGFGSWQTDIVSDDYKKYKQALQILEPHKDEFTEIYSLVNDYVSLEKSRKAFLKVFRNSNYGSTGDGSIIKSGDTIYFFNKKGIIRAGKVSHHYEKDFWYINEEGGSEKYKYHGLKQSCELFKNKSNAAKQKVEKLEAERINLTKNIEKIDKQIKTLNKQLGL